MDEATIGERSSGVLAAALGIDLGGGLQSAYASLVDLDGGRVLWFNRIVRAHGDLRDAGGAAETVDALLKNFPGIGAGATE